MQQRTITLEQIDSASRSELCLLAIMMREDIATIKRALRYVTMLERVRALRDQLDVAEDGRLHALEALRNPHAPVCKTVSKRKPRCYTDAMNDEYDPNA